MDTVRTRATRQLQKENQLLGLAYNSLRKRVADALIMLRDKFGKGKPSFGIHISREDLANIAGTATESLIRTLSDFRAEKLIDIKDCFPFRDSNNISWINFKLASALNLRPIVQLHRGNTDKIDTGKGFLGALEKLLEHVKKQIQQGLTSDVITMSYGGLLEEIKDEPVLVAFREFCKQHNLKTMLSMMSMTGAVNVGPKSFALSFATDKDLV